MRMLRNLCCSMIFIAGAAMLSSCGGGGGGGGFLPPSKSGSSGPTAKPGAFTLVSPAASDTADVKPTLTWSASSQAASYTVALSSSATFTPIEFNADVPAPSTISSVSTTLTDSTIYYWRVTAKNSLGETLATMGTATYGTFTAQDSGGVVWAKPLSIASQNAEALAMAIDGTYMYVVGYDYGASGNTDDEWRIEKRLLSTGAHETADFGVWQGHGGYITSNSGSALGPITNTLENVYSIALNTASAAMYLAGYETTVSGKGIWRIEKRDLVTGTFDNVFGDSGVISSDTGTGGSNSAYAMVLDSNALYLGGYDAYGSDGAPRWRIEKRDLNDGTLVSGFSTTGVISDPTVSSPSAVYALTISGPTGTTLYAAGYYTESGTSYWYLEAIDSDTGQKDSSFASDLTTNATRIEGTINGIVISGGKLYIAGTQESAGRSWWRIEKRNMSDGLVSSSTDSVISDPSPGDYNDLFSIASDGVYIYVAGYDSSNLDDSNPAYKGQWRIEKYDADLNSVATFGNNGAATGNPSFYDDFINAIAVDSAGIYLAGSQTDSTNTFYEWRIEKRTK